MTIIIRDIPESVDHKAAVPFKLFVPRDLDREAALSGYQALAGVDTIVLADPFIAEGVSSVFPGIIYVDEASATAYRADALALVAAALAPAVSDWPEAYEDAWIELWMPEAYEPAAEALAVDDLTQG